VKAHPDQQYQKQLELLLADKKFQQALRGYTGEDVGHDVAFLAGSEANGKRIDFDKDFVSAIQDGKIKFRGKSFDPRPLLRVHEAVEGTILLRHYSPSLWVLKISPENAAHPIALLAERHAAEHAFGPGSWGAYTKALQPYIKPDSTDAIKNPPPNILRHACARPYPEDSALQAVPKSKDLSNLNNMHMLIIRHGATVLNERHDSPDQIRGWKDVPLDAHGKREAKEVARQLAHAGIEAIWSSDLQRARATAEELGKTTGAPITYTHMLRPWNLGELTGKTTKDVMPKVRHHVMHPDEIVKDGESFNSFKSRTFAGMREAMRHTPEQVLAIVTHHRVERLLNAWDAAGQPDDEAVDIPTMLDKGEDPGKAQVFIFKRPFGGDMSVTPSVASKAARG
jgi:probable phosphoglycerate mutase